MLQVVKRLEMTLGFFSHFIAREVVPQTSNLISLINNVHTAYVILLSHFHGLFSLM